MRVHEQAIRMYPNPIQANGTLNLEISRPTTSVTVAMYDVAGRLVRRETRSVAPGTRFVAWDVRGEAAGMYFLRLAADTWQATHTMCVVR